MTIQEALADLFNVLGDRLTFSRAELESHSHSESHFSPIRPDAVAYPETTEEVSAIARHCSELGLPMIPWGTGTSLEGHSLPVRGGLTVDFSRMNRILAVNHEDMDVIVQPGVTRQELERHLKDTGLFFPVDPGANAALGGMAGTRASGTTTVRYGTMRDNVMALEVVLADGRIIRTGSRARKTSAGYDLTGLFVGSEGTLGLITELTLKLYGQPECIASAVCSFDRFSDAVDCVVATIQMGLPIARIEFVDGETAAAVNAYANASFPETPHLLIEFHGSEAAVAAEVETFGELVRDLGGSDFQWATKTEERRALWSMRHNAYYAILASRPGARAIVTDVCVPISRLARAVGDTRADIAASSIPGPILGHMGDGNYHAILMIDPASDTERDEAQALSERMVERALRLGGTATGEHGVGMGKLGYMDLEHGSAWDVMTTLKRALDPRDILNPGKVIRPDNGRSH